MTIVLVLAGAFAVVGGVAYFLQNRAKREGNLFTQPASRSTRIFAFLVGLLFAGFFVLEILSADRFHIFLPILAVALFAYSLGFNRMIESLLKKDH
jgi:hypothetical protein